MNEEKVKKYSKDGMWDYYNYKHCRIYFHNNI